MSDFIIDYEIMHSAVRNSWSLAREANAYADNLNGIADSIKSVGPSSASGNMDEAGACVAAKIQQLHNKANRFNLFAEDITTLIEKAETADNEVMKQFSLFQKAYQGHNHSSRINNILNLFHAITSKGEIQKFLSLLAGLLGVSVVPAPSLKDEVRKYYQLTAQNSGVKLIGGQAGKVTLYSLTGENPMKAGLREVSTASYNNQKFIDCIIDIYNKIRDSFKNSSSGILETILAAFKPKAEREVDADPLRDIYTDQNESRTLKMGCKGEDVKEMQKILLAEGYDLGIWGADGKFGSQTEEAVRQYQRDHNLKVDGKVGPATKASMGISGGGNSDNNDKDEEDKDEDNLNTGTVDPGDPVEVINCYENANLSDLDILARTLYSESDGKGTLVSMLAIANCIVNRYYHGGYSYTGKATYNTETGKYKVTNKVSVPNTLRNVCLSPVQFTGLTGSKENVNCGGSLALKPYTKTAKWKQAKKIAEQMLADPASIEHDLEEKLGVPIGYNITSYRSTSLYIISEDEETATSIETGKIYTIDVDCVIYGGNLYFLEEEEKK